MNRSDDGSQEWFDQLTRNRIRGGSLPTAPAQRISEIDPNTIADPTIRERLLAAKQAGETAKQRYTSAPHYGPAHLGGKVLDKISAQNYEISADVDAMTSAIEAKHLQQRQILNEVDSYEEQLQRMTGPARAQAMQTLNALQHRQTAYPNQNLARLNEIGNANYIQQQQMQQPQYPQMQQQNSSQVCRLIDGHPCFRALQTDAYGAAIVMARAVGQIIPQISMQEFVIRGYKNVYIVPPNQTMVDMNQIQRNPQLCTQLVEIMAPPASGLGILLVPKEAVATTTMSPNGQRGIITDSYQRNQQPQYQNQLPQQFINRAFQTPTQQPQQRQPNRGFLKG